MKPKTIIISVLLALIVIVLFNNKEEASFWLFGEIRTSKLIILGIFFLIGVVVGAVIFRRRVKHPKEYGLSNPNGNIEPFIDEEDPLSQEDREYIQKD